MFIVLLKTLSIIFFIFALLIILGIYFLKKSDERKQILQQAYSDATQTCSVRLVSVGPEKIKIIKTFRNYVDWDLTLAKQKSLDTPLPSLLFGKCHYHS